MKYNYEELDEYQKAGLKMQESLYEACYGSNKNSNAYWDAQSEYLAEKCQELEARGETLESNKETKSDFNKKDKKRSFGEMVLALFL